MCPSTWIIAIASVITALATVAIWRSATASNRLAQELAEASKRSYEDYKELLFYLTTATIVSGKFGDNPQDSINIFKQRLKTIKEALAEKKE